MLRLSRMSVKTGYIPWQMYVLPFPPSPALPTGEEYIYDIYIFVLAFADCWFNLRRNTIPPSPALPTGVEYIYPPLSKCLFSIKKKWLKIILVQKIVQGSSPYFILFQNTTSFSDLVFDVVFGFSYLVSVSSSAMNNSPQPRTRCRTPCAAKLKNCVKSVESFTLQWKPCRPSKNPCLS